MLTFLLLGAGIGFVAGISPGPVLTLVVSETLKAGWARGAAVAAGPLLADGPIIVLALLVLAQLPADAEKALTLGGGVFLLYLAATTAWQSRTAALPREHRAHIAGGMLKGVAARALSPNPYIFWLLVGAPILRGGSTAEAAAFLSGYYATIVGSNVGLAVVVHTAIKQASEGVYRGLLRVSAVILAVYGVLLLERARR